MTNMNAHENFKLFGWITVVVCIPTYLSIILISNAGMLAPFRKAVLNRYHKWRGKDPIPTHGSGLYKTNDRKKLKPIQTTAISSSLHRRLSSLMGDLEADGSGQAHNTRRRSKPESSHELRETRQNGSVDPVPTTRRPTIRFSEPFDDTGQSRGPVVAETSPITSDADVVAQMRRSDRAKTAPQRATERRESAPARLSLLRRFSRGSVGVIPVMSPV